VRFASRVCAVSAGATLGAVMTMLGPGSGVGAADPDTTAPANPFLKYWFTIAADKAQIDKLCDPATT
jgi:hypothetical protein